MSFPSSPVDNQSVTVNGITYIYSATYGTWTRQPASIPTTVSSFTNDAGYITSSNTTTQGTAAYNTANLAFTQANSAFNAANNVTPQIQPAFNTANLAYVQANTATTNALAGSSYANSAFIQANTALGDALSAGSYANSAFNQANTALGDALSAGSYANSAFIQANSAFIQANTAVSNAAAASSYANSAFVVANNNTGINATQNTNIGLAWNQANTAVNNALAASSYANSAFVQANLSFNQANSGVSIAQSAYNTANLKLNLTGGEITGSLTVDGQANVYQRLAVGTGSYTILPNLIAQFTGTSNWYSQINQQNLSGNGSADIVVTADNGTDQINFIDMGIAGSTYDDTTPNAYPTTKPNDGYLYLVGNPAASFGGNLVIGTAGSANSADISIVQGTGFTETARFVKNQGLVINKTTPSISNTTGALTVAGGVGVKGALYADSIYDGGTELKTYINTANTFLQSNDAVTLSVSKSYTDSANTIIQGQITNILGVDNTQNNNIISATSLAQNAYNAANAAITAAQDATYDQVIFNQANAAFYQANGAFTVANSAFTNAAAGSSYANSAFNQANGAYNQANTGTTLSQGAFNKANNALPLTGGSLSGALTINGDLTATGNVNFTGNVTHVSVQITGNTGQFFGYTANGFNSLYAGTPTGYASLPNEVAQFTSSNNSYTQINFQNENGGDSATTDWIATANNGTDTTYFVDLGIAGSGYDNTNPNNSLGSSLFPNDSYLYSQGNLTGGAYGPGGNLVIGTASTGRNIRFIAGGVNSSNIVLTLSPNNVIINQPLVFADGSSQNTAAATGTYVQSVYDRANSALVNSNSAFDKANTDFTNISISTGTFGGVSQIPVVVVAANGRITSIANTTISIPSGTAIFANSGQLTANASTGNVAIGLATTTVSAGWYGGPTQVPSINVDAYGRITSIANNAVSTTISLAGGTGTGSVSGGGTLTFTGGTGVSTSVSGSAVTFNNTGVLSLTSNNTGRITQSGTTGDLSFDLATSGVTGGTYSYPQLTVDSYGRVTVISNQTPVTSFNTRTGSITLISADVTGALGYTPLDSSVYSTAPGSYANSAFIQANTAVGNAAAASSYANSAFNQANTAVGNAAAASSYANSAFVQANTATTLAQGAFDKANTAGGGGVTYTAANTAPVSPHIGDQWYKINQNILFEYVYDGTSNNWVDVITPVSPGGSIVNTTRTQSTATAGQTTFTAPYYTIGQNQLNVYVNGVRQFPSSYTEASTTTFTLSSAVPAGTLVLAEVVGYAINPYAGGVTVVSDTSTPTIYYPLLYNSGTGTLTTATTSTSKLSYVANTGTMTANNIMVSASLGVGTAPNGNTGQILATGSITQNYSDERLKSIQGNITNALEKVMSLNGFYYHANEIAQKFGYEVKSEVGVSAQQVQKVLPEVVVPAPIDNNYLTVQYEKMVPLLIEAIKEQQSQIEELKQRLQNK